jgi:glycerophosphoryl diester phosphodiesterase
MLERKTIVAHRGLSGDEPENTLEAFAASVARGVEAIELDVRQTVDGVLVIFHDAKVGKAAITRSTYAELLARAPALCTLGQALEIVPSQCLLDVEIKVPGIERAVLDVLEPRRKTSDFVVTSFHDHTVAQVKALDSTIRVGLVLGVDRPKHGIWTRLSEFFPAIRLRRSRSDFVVLNRRLLRSGVLRRMAWQGYPVWVWTVNKPVRLKRMLTSPHVAAVVTDRPVKAMALRAELERSRED